MLIIGLIISAAVSLGMGFVHQWEIFYLLAFLTGFVSNIGEPAAHAMMADILPQDKRTEGYGILRVVINLAATIGPVLGGILSGISFLSLNAAMVVLFQFATARIVKKNPFRMMALGNLLYAVGFGLYGFVSAYGFFIFDMVIITIGEMVIAPIVQTIITDIAPEDMRGRYMAAFHVSWGIAAAVGSLAAGIIIDNYNPNWVWYAGGIICVITALGYLGLKSKSTEMYRRLEKVESD
jgi:MFS family permease